MNRSLFAFAASMILSNISGQISLADELSQHQFQQNQMTNQYQRTLLTRKCGYLLDEDSSPDSDRLHSLGDVDSGHSTAHSPTDLKSLSPQMVMSPSTQSQSLTASTFGGLVNIRRETKCAMRSIYNNRSKMNNSFFRYHLVN